MSIANPAAEAAAPISAAEKQPISKTAVAAAIAGNALEFYDFIVYAFFAVYIGRTFFPAGNDTTSLLASVAVYGVGFFTRPLGGLVIGAFADKAGRKPAMILTVALITVGTLGLAATPGYAQIGVAAPIIVVFCRLLQGLAIGGEVGPSTALLVEAAPDGRRGMYASWQIASQGLAVVGGGLCGVVVSASMSEADLASWGWRLPFLISLLLIPIAIYIRKKLPETHEGGSDMSGSHIVRTVFTKYRRYVLLGTLVMLAGTVSTQVGNYMTTYAIQTLKLPPTLAQVATVAGGAATFLFALASGWLSDHVGRKTMMIAPRVALTVLIVPLFLWLVASPSPVVLIVVTMTITTLTGMSAAASLVAIPELMPVSVRSTGTSLIYSIGATLFGSSTQFIITWLIKEYDSIAPAWYTVVTSLVTLVAMAMLPETRHVDVKK